MEPAEFAPGPFHMQSAEMERSKSDAKLAALGHQLADPARANRPVLYYGTCWIVAPRVRPCSTYFPLDALMYSELLTPGADFLSDTPDAFVIMTKGDYQHIFEGKAPSAP